MAGQILFPEQRQERRAHVGIEARDVMQLDLVEEDRLGGLRMDGHRPGSLPDSQPVAGCPFTLRAIAGALRPGGRLGLLVPANPKLYGRLDRGYGHVRRYTPGGLRARLTRVWRPALSAS